MAREFRAKVFKSGNSFAIRIPKSWGLLPGTELEVVVDDDGRILARPIVVERRTLADLFGSFSKDFMAEGRLPADAPKRDWDGKARSRTKAA
jgi:antitoxin VapB